MNLLDQLMEQKMKVDFNTYDLTLKELIGMVRDNMIDIAPEYQRQFRWDKDRQSSLIESLFLGIPVPSLFMATNSDGTWELIDGVQRVGTILVFAGEEEERDKIKGDDEDPKKPLLLEGLAKLSEFNGKGFNDLPGDIQTRFKLTSIKITTLTDKSDKNVRFDLFERLNKGGVTLSDQEIRSCVYQGEFNNFITELAKNKDFKNCVRISENKTKAGLDKELVLRFFAYLYDIKNFTHSVKDFLNDYMQKAGKDFDYTKGRNVFSETFKALSSALPEGINRYSKRTPINLYEGVAVGAAMAYSEKGEINTSGVDEWINDGELTELTRGATNTKSRLLGRIEYCKQKFEA